MKFFRNRCVIAHHFFRKKTFIDGHPIELAIELTSRCNLTCIMCPRSDNSLRGLGNMELETFKKIIEPASEYVEFSWLHLSGEPLLHPDFDQFIEMAADYGITVGMSTNGTVLTPEKCERLIKSRLTTLIISLDATDESSYSRIRGANAFSKVTENALSLLRMKKRQGTGPRIVLQMISLQENRFQARQFKKFWKEQGADGVYIKRFTNFGGQVPSAHGNSSFKTPSETSRKPCYFLWRQMAFYYDGTAVACCFDFNHQATLGNIHHQTLKQIWNSMELREMRKKHREGRQSEIPLCAGCEQPEINAPMILAETLLGVARTRNIMMPVFMWLDSFRRLLRSSYGYLW